MKNKGMEKLLLLIWLSLNSVLADDLCPQTGNSKIPEIYPVEAYIVSQEFSPSDPHVSFSARHYAENVVLEILKASEESPRPIILQLNSEQFAGVRARVQRAVAEDPGRRSKWLSALQHEPVQNGYNWQQDYFENFIDFKTGTPVIRLINNYTEGVSGIHLEKDDLKIREAQKVVKNSAQKNGWKFEEPLNLKEKLESQSLNAALEDLEREGLSKDQLPAEEWNQRLNYQKEVMVRHAVNNLAGGNIEGLPGGLCMRGNNQPSSYTRQYCGDKSNEVVLETSWLEVGHVDEIMQVVKNSKAQAPCDFAISYSSPRKGIEILKKNGSEIFFEGYAQEKRANLKDRVILSGLDESDKKIFNTKHPLYSICRAVACNRARKSQPTQPSVPIQNIVPAASWLFQNAYAGISVRKNNNVDTFSDQDLDEDLACDIKSACKPDEILKMTNREVAEAIEADHNLKLMNLLIDEKMQINKDRIQKKLKERLPQCQPEFIELPDLFHPSGEYQVELKSNLSASCKINPSAVECYQLPTKSMLSIQPNPANAITVHHSVLVPHPQNASYAKYIEGEYKKLGIKTSFVDTYEAAHLGQGNLHCSTHVINSCRPLK